MKANKIKVDYRMQAIMDAFSDMRRSERTINYVLIVMRLSSERLNAYIDAERVMREYARE